MSVTLYIGNLSYSTDENELQELFGQAGKVVSVSVIKDKVSGRSKGFAFVEMEQQSEADEAISKFNGYKLSERELKVSVARPKEERSGDFGFKDRRGPQDRNRRSGGQRRY